MPGVGAVQHSLANRMGVPDVTAPKPQDEPAGTPCGFCGAKAEGRNRVFKTTTQPICGKCCRKWVDDYISKEAK